METFVSYLLTIVAGALAIPVGMFFLEVAAAIVLPRRHDLLTNANPDSRRRVAVLVPAHNESTGLLPTLGDIKVQLRAGDRLLVVADNCTDDTASVAAAAGAEVITRSDQTKIGKGYALEWGVRHLYTDPPDVVIVIDADCRVADGSIDNLSITCALTGRPAQGLDLMMAPAKSEINHQVAEFAWRVKNWVRPLGLLALGMPCQLMGTGMAFPWAIIRSAKIASGQVVEDLQLGLDLAMAGSLTIFCPSARVTSTFPTSATAADHQRQRWEHGHLDTILALVPRLIISAVTRRNVGQFALALDLSVPPLVFLGMLTISVLFLSSLSGWLIGSYVALIIGAVVFIAFTSAVILSWVVFGRDVLPCRAVWSIAPYILRKFSLYWRFLSGNRVSRWIRTDRG
jgi:cellulose synthase/poly-beta-1,6-N-acetylglucosamine synthase-like glycosyltransferase